MIGILAWISTMVGAYILLRCIEIGGGDSVKSDAGFKVIVGLVALTAIGSTVRIWMLKSEVEDSINNIPSVQTTEEHDTKIEFGG